MIARQKETLELKDLIEGAKKGDRQFQNELYQRLKQAMFLVCLRYAKSRAEAEDILQEGFIKMFLYIGQYKFQGPFEGWVRKIMVNCALQKNRTLKYLYSVDSPDFSIKEPGEETITAQMGAKELLKMVQDLPRSYRIVFNLYVFEGLKHREIAEKLGISEGTSKSNLSDARQILQKRIYQDNQFGMVAS